jgi:hypothetical protein
MSLPYYIPIVLSLSLLLLPVALTAGKAAVRERETEKSGTAVQSSPVKTSGSQKEPSAPLDRNLPDKFETATFALG